MSQSIRGSGPASADRCHGRSPLRAAELWVALQGEEKWLLSRPSALALLEAAPLVGSSVSSLFASARCTESQWSRCGEGSGGKMLPGPLRPGCLWSSVTSCLVPTFLVVAATLGHTHMARPRTEMAWTGGGDKQLMPGSAMLAPAAGQRDGRVQRRMALQGQVGSTSLGCLEGVPPPAAAPLTSPPLVPPCVL